METPVSPLGRGLIWVLCGFFAVAVAWSIIGKVDVVAIADGKVIPHGKTKVVQPLEIGVIRAIHVQDGDRVKAGQDLIDLDPTDASADYARMERERVARTLDILRLDSLLAGGPSAAPLTPKDEKIDPLLLEAARQLLRAQWQERIAKLAALDGEIEQRRADLRVAETDIERLNAVLPLLRDRTESMSGLAKQGLASRLRVSELQQQLIETEKGLASAVEKRQQAEAAIRAAEQQRQQAERESESNWRKERADALEKRSAAEQEILKARKRRDLQQLTSPIDGTVTNLATWTVGGIVKPGDTLLNVVPLAEQPEIEAMALNKDIGFIRPGQPVTVKFDAFPFTRYGTLSGEVIDISRDANKDDKLGLIYPVRIRLAASDIAVDGARVSITPGMAASAEIVTGQRRLIEFILSPLLRYRDEAGRER
ncbi:HlyD family type I secretion periplasmic adaptor subunit [Enhydrobacter aerosaccus]|nr:HlyD family type I secretion periplasmic adaptor subunit [Enhydrobacter aerosaccus]